MGYVLRNGKRYYQDKDGNLSLDNVSQEEADKRERRNKNPVFTRTNTCSETFRNSAANRVTGTVPERRTVSCGLLILMAVVLTLIGAVFYNQSHVSSAEKAIATYMDNVADSSD